MKIFLISLLISISLHFLLFLKYKDTKIDKIDKKYIKKSQITYVKIKKANNTNIINKKKVKTKKAPKPNKIKVQKKISKPKITKKKLNKKLKKAKEFQKKVVKNQIVKNQNNIQEKTLENFLSQKEPINKKLLSKIERLYGREYQNFTKLQKAFIEKNLNTFQAITQKVLDRLGYPPIAAMMRVYGTNIVEFYLLPNGDIQNLKISSSSSYNVLDEYTLELIQIAYKEYPRPKTKTKLKFNVHYRLY